MPGQILLHRATAEHAQITISNPGKRNAIDYAMWLDLSAMMDELARDPRLRCVSVKGAAPDKDEPPAFAAGGDLAEFLQKRITPAAALDYHERAVAPALNALAHCPVPVVAAIDGACIGGGLEIAACCDIRVATDRSSFGAPILKLGFNMYAGELEHVLAAAGPAVVSEILLEGRILNTEEAYAKGLLSRVVSPESLTSELAATCARICSGAPLVAREHKVWIRRLRGGRPASPDEKAASLRLVASEDYREGLEAFFAKRQPDFKGR